MTVGSIQQLSNKLTTRTKPGNIKNVKWRLKNKKIINISIKQREDKNEYLATEPSEHISGSLRAPDIIT